MKKRSFNFKAIIITIVSLLFLVGCEVTAFSNLSESSINEMIALLRNYGIQATKSSGLKETWNLNVPDEDFARSIDILKLNGLPKEKYDTLGSVFTKGSMVSTPLEEQARMLYALSQELAGTIAQIDGVLASRVHIVLPEVDSFGKKLSSASASVFIKHRIDMDFEAQVAQIKKLVENSVRDLRYDDISVFLFPSSSSYEPIPVEVAETKILGISSLYFWFIIIGVLTLIICVLIVLLRLSYVKKNKE